MRLSSGSGTIKDFLFPENVVFPQPIIGIVNRIPRPWWVSPGGEKNVCSSRSSLTDSEAHRWPSLLCVFKSRSAFRTESSLGLSLYGSRPSAFCFSPWQLLLFAVLYRCYINYTRPSREAESSSNSAVFSMATRNLDLLELLGNEVHGVWSALLQERLSPVFQGHVELVSCSVCSNKQKTVVLAINVSVTFLNSMQMRCDAVNRKDWPVCSKFPQFPMKNTWSDLREWIRCGLHNNIKVRVKLWFSYLQ